jgi:KipI family sensor histidine kinase inhibitor
VTNSPARIREAGDSALLLELEGVIDPDVNARVIAIARVVREALIAGVRAVVPTYRSVAVFFDPLVTDAALVAHVLREAQHGEIPVVSSRTVEVPVSYGGENGPDLEHVAARVGISVQDVIERHASTPYRVYMFGFLPGFAYMGTVDESIAAPRRATPRVRVPAGSVGIAGRQTGVYPRESPGGWQLIGRTPVDIFDPARIPAAFFASGDEVRFVPLTARDAGAGLFRPRVRLDADRGNAGSAAGMTSSSGRQITVMKPGLLTTIQDRGRWGHQAFGVPVSGPMDEVSYRLANTIVGNPSGAAVLEATVTGPELRIETESIMAVTGADLGISLDGSPLALNAAILCPAGCTIRCGERRNGARAYIAFDGGIGTPPVLGSRATHMVSELGGIAGRPLKADDVIPLQPRSPASARPKPRAAGPIAMGGARLRVLLGPQDEFFAPAALETLQQTRFTITAQSDRMGYRLAGRARIERAAQQEMISDATFVGAIQVPPSGDPILLMADRQTTGGYPQIATVITADLPLAGQLAPGDWVEFQLCTRAEAIAALAAQEAKLLALR